MKKTLSQLAQYTSAMDDYDPNALPVTQAKALIAQFLTPITQTEVLPLMNALGRVLAQPIMAPHNVPNHNNSAMDGYAYRAQDYAQQGETTLTVIGTAFAGKPFTGTVNAGECVRIMTGAVMPQGADTVIMQERVQVLTHTNKPTNIAFSLQQSAGANVRYAGEDMAQGDTVLAQGRRLRPAELGLLASLGIAQVSVYRPLTVAFFSTGDELINLGQPLQTGQLYDSNRYTIFGMLQRLGCHTLDLGNIPDNPALLEAALLNAAQQADVIISSGGVSVGEADYMKDLLARHGQVLFWKLAIKPGRPLAYGKIDNAHYFGLPGNPVSAMVTFYQFVREALLQLAGEASPAPQPLLQAPCSAPIKKAPGRMEFQRGVLFADAQGTWQVRPLPQQGSGILRSMSEANCFIVLDEACGNLEAGSVVNIQVLEGVA